MRKFLSIGFLCAVIILAFALCLPAPAGTMPSSVFQVMTDGTNFWAVGDTFTNLIFSSTNMEKAACAMTCDGGLSQLTNLAGNVGEVYYNDGDGTGTWKPATIPIDISWNLERPTNATYNIKWFYCARREITFERLVGKTEAGTVQGHIIQSSTNAAWGQYTTNLASFSIGTNGTSFNSYTNFVDATLEIGSWVGWIITNDVTGVTNGAFAIHEDLAVSLAIPIDIAYSQEVPTNDVYNIKWLYCAPRETTLIRLVGKTRVATVQGHIIQAATNAAWAQYTTNLASFSIGTNGTSFTSYRTFVDSVLEEGQWLGIITTNATGALDFSCAIHAIQ